MKKQTKRTDKRRLFVVVLACVLVLALLLPLMIYISTPAGAVTQSEINNLKANAAKLAEQKKGLSQKISELAQDKERVLEQKAALDQQNALLQDEIDNTTALIAQYDVLIKEKAAELEEAKRKEQEQYALFCKRVRSMEESGSDSYLAALFGATDFGDLVDRVTFIQEIMEYDQNLMDQLAAAREAIAEKKAELETAQKEQKQAKADLQARQNELEAQIQEAIALVNQLAAQKEEYQSALQQLEKDEDRISAEIEQKIAALEKKNATIGVTIKSESGYLWPLNGYTRVSSGFGGRIHPLTGRWKVHTGLDIPAPGGTPIHATKSGTVVVSAYGSSYGNYVSISHGGGNSSLYAHMSRRAVSVGQTVKQGQVIGYVGTTGSSTGNHLHFEIRVNGARINPKSVF
ncbi:MAG: peptidoglycan DD-metalloendopeptidase family protein [Oscillospiraceae bacterium]|nr:peptidoglycan DD-metalloendopeptidase family protein [Oscillospiraceae bacterium]